MVVVTTVTVILRFIGDEGLSGENHGGDGSGILQTSAGHLSRVHDSFFHHVDIFTGHSVVAVTLFEFTNTLYNHGTFESSIVGDDSQRLGDGLANDLNTEGFVTLSLSLSRTGAM